MKKYIKLSVICALFLNSIIAHADASCNVLMDDLIAYASKNTDKIFHPGNYKIVRVKMITNRPDSRYASFAEGTLKRFETVLHRPRLPPIMLSQGLVGPTTQTFSDRTDYITGPCNPGELCPGFSQQFTAKKADKLGMSIDRSGDVKLTLTSWGNGVVPLTGTCTNKMLHASSTDGTVYIFSFIKDTQSGEPA